MNLLIALEEGKEGKNKGLPTGLYKLDRAIDGIQKRAIYTIAADAKVGKTTFVDKAFLLEPFLYLLDHPDEAKNVRYIYFSFEISRIKKEFKLACFFFNKLYSINSFVHKDKEYVLSPRYLMGRLRDKDNELIPIQEEHEKVLLEIYQKYIIPLFGEYDTFGNKIKDGFVEFIEERDNPTGLAKYLYSHASKNGEFVMQNYTIKDGDREIPKQRIIGYNPKNQNEHVIIITDHMRKLRLEKGYTIKQNVDRWVEYQVDMRNLFGYTFIDIIHLNRSMSEVDRLRYMGDKIYPTSDDIKDTGNLSEESDYIFTLFNPKDEKYNLNTHFGIPIPNENYRSLHLVQSRDTECPLHLRMEFYGNINDFIEL